MECPPSTADPLARLAELESRFQQTLEAEKLEAMAEFAAGAGHEINNPLTVISGRAQLLLRDETDPERRHVLALIVAQAMRVYEMVADMMLFARPPQPELHRIELVELLDAVVADMSPRSASQETAICRTGEPGPIFVDADPVQLKVALRAICQNSLEALQSGGHVEIAVETRANRSPTPGTTHDRLAAAGTAAPGVPTCVPLLGTSSAEGIEVPGHRSFQAVAHRNEICELADSGTAASGNPAPDIPSLAARREVWIQIHDDGPGLKPEERRHIFDPFYSARQAGRGLGLGLSKAWRIVTNHGGRIEVESLPGQGATFTIVLGISDQV
jgi:signal transduction histidine kinase